jgi:Cu+-exporting ATPase
MGINFYVSAYKSLKHKSANMDVLIVIGTTSAWLYGVILIFAGYTATERASMAYRNMIHEHVHNFETSSFIIMIVLVGKFIESYSKMKTVDKLSDLASLKVSKANLLDEKDLHKISLGSAFNEIPIELLEIGDFVIV